MFNIFSWCWKKLNRLVNILIVNPWYKTTQFVADTFGFNTAYWGCFALPLGLVCAGFFGLCFFSFNTGMFLLFGDSFKAVEEDDNCTYSSCPLTVSSDTIWITKPISPMSLIEAEEFLVEGQTLIVLVTHNPSTGLIEYIPTYFWRESHLSAGMVQVDQVDSKTENMKILYLNEEGVLWDYPRAENEKIKDKTNWIQQAQKLYNDREPR